MMRPSLESGTNNLTKSRSEVGDVVIEVESGSGGVGCGSGKGVI